MKILIVDDEINIAQGIKAMLLANISFPASVKCVSSAEDALKMAGEFRPNLLITDIRMPKVNGLELIDRLKEEQWCDYFIILSGYEDFSYAQKAMRKGVADYLTKPVEKDYLIALCERFNSALQRESLRQSNGKLPEFEFLEWEPYQEDYSASLKNIIRYIECNYMKKELSGQSISETLFFHQSYISQLIGKHTGKSLNGIINYFRLKKATELLLSEQNYTISDISSMVGYNSERQLYKAFQKYFSCTPSVFRNEYSQSGQWKE